MKGIDGTRDGWIVAEYTGDSWLIEKHRSLSGIEFETALIDIPIGLPEKSVRECDRQARKFLVPQRHYSVFNCPVRKAVYAESYEQACDINEKKTGKRISRQAWNICPKIREADKIAKNKDLRESHPEVFFKAIEESSVEHSKSTEEGFEQRKEVLKTYGNIEIVEKYPESIRDDLLDAMVLSLASEFDLEQIPASNYRGSKNLPMRIVKPKL